MEAPEPVTIEPLWRFSIPNPEPLGRPIISIDDVWFDYTPVDVTTGIKKPKEDWILQKVNFGVDLDSRIGILGKFAYYLCRGQQWQESYYIFPLPPTQSNFRKVPTVRGKVSSAKTYACVHRFLPSRNLYYFLMQ